MWFVPFFSSAENFVLPVQHYHLMKTNEWNDIQHLHLLFQQDPLGPTWYMGSPWMIQNAEGKEESVHLEPNTLLPHGTIVLYGTVYRTRPLTSGYAFFPTPPERSWPLRAYIWRDIKPFPIDSNKSYTLSEYVSAFEESIQNPNFILTGYVGDTLIRHPAPINSAK